jgi:hypothetical protein
MTALTLEELEWCCDKLDAWISETSDPYWEETNDKLTRLVAAARAHLTSQAWREISTAPKVSQHLLMFGDGRGFEQCIFVGRWKDDEFGGQWVLAFDGRAAAPTHWMSLPPTTNTNGERDAGLQKAPNVSGQAQAAERLPCVPSNVAGRAGETGYGTEKPHKLSGTAGVEVAAPAITEGCMHVWTHADEHQTPSSVCIFCHVPYPLPEPIAAGEELRILRSGLERIGKIANTDPWRTFDGMIQDMQLIDDICRGLNSDPIIPPPIAAGEEDSRAVWKDGVLMNCYDCGSPLDSEMRCPKCAPAIHEAVWIDGKPGYRIVIPPIAAGGGEFSGEPCICIVRGTGPEGCGICNETGKKWVPSSPSSSDLVERLRKGRSANEWVSEELAREAAATIQRLEADNQAWKEAWEREHAHCNAYNEEITALQSECNELRPKLANALAQLDRSQSERDRLRKALEEIRLLDRFADPGEPWQYGLFASIARAALAGKD